MENVFILTIDLRCYDVIHLYLYHFFFNFVFEFT